MDCCCDLECGVLRTQLVGPAHGASADAFDRGGSKIHRSRRENDNCSGAISRKNEKQLSGC